MKKQGRGKTKREYPFATNSQCVMELCKGNRNLEETEMKY